MVRNEKHIPLEDHCCVICGVKFQDQVHPDDEPLCDDCLAKWRDEVDPYNWEDELEITYFADDVAYASWMRGEE